LVKQFIEYLAVVNRRMGYCMALYKLVFRISINVIFIALMLLVDFLRPAHFGIFLPTPGLSVRLIPCIRHLTFFNLGVLFTAITLLGHFNKGGVNHLSRPGHLALRRQLFMKPGK
jgi:hypothetical protein